MALPEAGLEHVQASAACPLLLLLQLLRAASGQVRAAAATGKAGGGSYQQAAEIEERHSNQCFRDPCALNPDADPSLAEEDSVPVQSCFMTLQNI